MTARYHATNKLPPASPLRSARSAALGFALLALAIASGCGLFYGISHWRLEVFSHFRWPLFALSAAMVLATLVCRHRFMLLVAFALLCFNGSLLVHNLFPPASVAKAKSLPNIRALSINVYSQNDGINLVTDYIREQSPDIVALIEITGKWKPVLDELRGEYPHQARQIWGDNFGSAILSRYPLSEPPRSYGYGGVGSLARIVKTPQGSFLAVQVHPIAPITPNAWKWNANSLNDLAKYANAARAEQPVLVMGDLNASPWGAAFKSLLGKTSLRPPDSKRIWWPTWRVVAWPAAIPIDHFLLSPGLQDTRSWVGRDVGSDHYPIGIDFALTGKDRP